MKTVIPLLQPYLHESRHLHALNRVRGSGGRFLSKKQLENQQPDPSSTAAATSCNPDSAKLHQIKKDTLELESHHSGFSEYVTTVATRSDTTTMLDSSRRFPGGGGMQCSGVLLRGGTQHCASVVRWQTQTVRCPWSGKSSLALSTLFKFSLIYCPWLCNPLVDVF